VFGDYVSQHNLYIVDLPSFKTFVDWMYEAILPSHFGMRNVPFMFKSDIIAKKTSSWTIEKRFGQTVKAYSSTQVIADSYCIGHETKELDVKCFAMIYDLPEDSLTRVVRKLHQLSELAEADRKLRHEVCGMMECVQFGFRDKK
jgi:hypothetical protein